MGKGSKYSYLAKNTTLFAISSFGSKLLSFFLVPLYTAVLSTEDYGTADLVTTTAGLLVYVFTLDIQSAVLRFAIERKERQEEILNVGLRIVGLGSALLGVGVTVCKCLHVVVWEDYCYLFLFLSFFFSALSNIFSCYLRAVDKVAAVAVSGILSTAVIVGSNLLFLLVFHMGIIGYMLSHVIGSLVIVIYALISLRGKCWAIFRANCSRQTKKAMCAYSIPLIFNAVSWWMNGSIDKYFLTAMLSVGVNGIYAVSQKIPSILSICSTIFGQAWNISAIKEFDREDEDGFFSSTYKFYNSGLVIICSALILLNIPIARFLFSKDFFAAWQYSSVLLISMIFSSMSTFLGSVFSAVKESKILAVSAIIGAAINIALNATMIPAWGALGAAIATAVSFFAVWLIRLLCAKKWIHMKLNLPVDFIAYGLLILQVVFEHTENHFYAGQALISAVIVLLYRESFLKIFRAGKVFVSNGVKKITGGK